MNRKPALSDWILFLVLSLVWGSSFILMKIGLEQLSAYQVAAIRILSGGLVLLPFAIKKIAHLPKKTVGVIVLSGAIGSFFPAFLFCLAETRIDSGFAAILNSLTPFFTIMIGVILFQLQADSAKIVGVLIGLVGLILLPLAGKSAINFKDLQYASLALIATASYAVNINIVGRYLKNIPAADIASLSFALFIIPCVAILMGSGFFQLFFSENVRLSTAAHFNSLPVSIAAAAILGIFGSAIATILFYKLIKSVGAVFASLVTYGSPCVAIVWGLVAGESITLLQIGCLGIILTGVYIVNRK